MSKKINSDYILAQYQSGINSYISATESIGLWESEKYVFQKYITKSDHILDLGCGTGRTTFPLYQMGYTEIVGVDLTSEMIEEAQRLSQNLDVQLDFRVGDARSLSFEDANFDVVIFSFNGLMSIPGQSNRDAALRETYRVLKRHGLFIFTTHDRNKEPQFYPLWQKEREKWEEGQQDPRLYEFGDLITHSKNETREIFIHIPSEEEITEWVSKHGFEIEETFYRSEKLEESEEIKKMSGECRFWVIRKIT